MEIKIIRKIDRERAFDTVNFRSQIFRNIHSELRIRPRSGCIEIIKIWLQTIINSIQVDWEKKYWIQTMTGYYIIQVWTGVLDI